MTKIVMTWNNNLFLYFSNVLLLFEGDGSRVYYLFNDYDCIFFINLDSLWIDRINKNQNLNFYLYKNSNQNKFNHYKCIIL